MGNIIAGGILIAVIAAAVRFIYKEKKRGVKCIGCSAAGSCGGSCSCSGHSDK